MPAVGGRARRALLVALTAIVLVTACTGDDDRASPASTTTGEPSGGGTMRLGVGGDLVVDPVAASLASPGELMVLDLLHDGLTRLDAAGVAQPALATDWMANDARTAFRFQLDPDRTFASGDPVTPEDVIASLERVMAAGDTSLTALSLEAVEGFRAFVVGDAEHVSGLTALPGGIVRVGLATPLSVLPEVLSNPMLSVVDADTIEADDLEAVDLSGSWSPVPTDDDTVRVERQEDTGAHLAAVELHAFSDDDAAYGAFERGEVDWAEVPSARYDDAVDGYGDDAFAPFHAELYFGMNVSSQNLGNAAFRQAIALAIDRDAITDTVYADLADPLASVVPAGVVGHDPDRCGPCAHDPGTAADIVSFIFPDGDVPTVRIDFDESTPQDGMAELIAGDLEEVGIPTELRPLPLDDYKRFVVSGDQELFSFGWIGAYGSPDAYLAPLFGSAANDNLTDFRSELVDGLLDRARAGADASENAERWTVAEARILEAWVIVPVAQFRTQVVVAQRVEGFAHAVDGTVDWTEVRLLA